MSQSRDIVGVYSPLVPVPLYMQLKSFPGQRNSKPMATDTYDLIFERTHISFIKS